MNILFFLTPKKDVDCIYVDDTVGDALRSLENHRYSALPIIDEKTGRYIGTLSEGDILRDITTRDDLPYYVEESRPIMKVRRKRDYHAVNAGADMEELFQSAQVQNFVPVTDDTGAFIGIITRSSIMQFLISDRKPK